jgi:hypothetical protein
MAESYHIIQGNVITVNFVYSRDSVLFYPDMIKVGIALDDGSLMTWTPWAMSPPTVSARSRR